MVLWIELWTDVGNTIAGITTFPFARVPGTSYELDPVQAAFNIGALVRWLDFNDTWLAAEWGHPSDNLGAILAVSDWISRNKAAGAPLAAFGSRLSTLSSRPAPTIKDVLDKLGPSGRGWASVPRFAPSRPANGDFREPARSDHSGREHRKRRMSPFAGRNGANGKALVEPRGIEPLTSSLRTTRSPI